VNMTWTTVPLGEVLHKSEEWITIEPKTKYKEVKVRLWGKGVVQRRLAEGSEIAASRRIVVRANQFILSRIDARHGALGLVPDSLDGAVVSTDFPVFSLNTGKMLPAFLNWLAKTQGFIDICKAASVGTTNRIRLKEERFLAMKLPLPSLTEQQHIVARIEELAEKIAEARGLRFEAEKQAERLHGSFVASLFKSQPNDKRIAIEAFADVRGGIQKGAHRAPKENPVRYLTVAHVHRNCILLSDPRFFEVNKQELERWRLMPGDVLIIEGNGSAEQIGRTAIFRGELEDCVHQNHVIRIRPDKKLIDPEFLNLYLNSPAGQDEVQSLSRTSSGLRTLSVGRIKQIAVPLLPLAQQAAIVSSADAIQSKIDSLRQLQTQTAAELDAMLPAVLDKAFKGEL
jgi:type I restriction enzyme S subunit